MTAKLLVTASGDPRVAEIENDDLIINGPVKAVVPFTFDPDGDHRLAMAAGVLARLTKGPCEILGPDCVNVSFPDFFKLIGSISS
jgi:3-phosphoshikimate 1-carboxyvinyltransferase